MTADPRRATFVEGRRSPPGRGGSVRRGSRGRVLGALLPLSLIVAGVANLLQVPMNMFDGGLLLTLARFTGWSRLPYRDLWTVYGPGPAVVGSVVSDVFGPGVLQSRVASLVFQALFVVAAYAVMTRFVAWWWAASFAVALASFAFAHYFHFVQSLTFLLWGVWFLLRAEENDARRRRRLVIAAFLFGMSFWGRYELAPVGVALVVGMWWWLRPSLDRVDRRMILLAGLLPSVVFVVYLLGVVGWDRAYLNLVEYPFVHYPRAECRGLPDVWGAALHALAAPLRGSWWTPKELVLWGGTFLPPIAGGLAVVAGLRRWKRRSASSFALLAVGALTLVIWLEHRPRAGGEPYPTWGLLLVSATMLLALLGERRARLASAVSLGVAAIILATAVGGWLPGQLGPWGTWPPYHSLYGYARGESSGLYDEDVWSGVTASVQQHALPEDEIFVALMDNRFQLANAPLFYWLVDRPPASRFIEFDPCLTDTAAVQRDIVGDLEHTEVVITTSFFARPPPAPLGPPTTVLDDYLSRHFDPVYRGELAGGNAVEVLVRGPFGDD